MSQLFRQPRQRDTLMAIITVVVWLIVAPVQLGGNLGYILVNGNSMFPMLKKGDLVVIRRADSYDVGDVVTYEAPRLGPVIHRIVAFDDDGRYVMKGDHNGWLDTFHPANASVTGKLWLHIPGAGKWLQSMSPGTRIALVGSFVGVGAIAMLVSNSGTTQRRSKRQRSQDTRKQDNNRKSSMGNSAPSKDAIMLVLGAFGALGIGLGVIAFTQPIQRVSTAEPAYQHQAVFSYAAADTRGIYDNGLAVTTQPIFYKFTPSMTVTFTYLFWAGPIEAASGSYGLTAEVGDASGWRRTLELAPRTAFPGNSVVTSHALNLTRVQQMIAGLETATGVKRKQYTVSVVAHVHMNGISKDTSWQEDYEPRMDFVLNDDELRLVDKEQVNQTLQKTIKQEKREPNEISLLMFHFGVATARVVSAIAVVIGGLGLALMAHLRSHDSAVSQITGKYASLLVNVDRVQPTGVAIDVSNMEDLVKLAERDNYAVLHEVAAGTHHFFVQEDGVLFRFAIAEPCPSSSPRRNTWYRRIFRR